MEDFFEDQRQGDLFRFGYVDCANCGTLVWQDDARKHVYYDQSGQQVVYFCSDSMKPEESCHDIWYMEKLRKEGM